MKSGQLIAFGTTVAVMASAMAAGEPADWVQLIPMGRFGGRDGRGPYLLENKVHAAEVIAASRAYAGSADAVVDYDHQTDFGAQKGVGGRAPASGWIKDYEVRDDGIWGRVEWTEAAHAQLKAGEYRYISPVFPHEKDTGRVRAILRAGLTNSPNLDLVAVASQQTEGPSMSLTAIAAALGLGEAATEADCLGAITSLNASAAGLVTVAQAAGLAADAAAGDIVTAISATITPDPAKYVPIATVLALQSQISTGSAEQARAKAEADVDDGIAKGKIAPALRDTMIALASSDRAAFDAFIGKAPVILAPGKKADAKVEGKPGALTTEELSICSAMGLTEDEFRAAKSKEQ